MLNNKYETFSEDNFENQIYETFIEFTLSLTVL